MKYRKEIDGLRAVSVLAVMAFHLNLFHAPGGYWGVDVFFVISGYLISTLLFEEARSTGTVSLRRFYLRRAKRILPMLLVTCGATALAVLLVFRNGPHMATIGESVIASLASVANFFYWTQSGYFAPDVITHPLLHTWSLSVEEQFYAVFPFLVLLCTWFKTRRHVWTLLIFTALTALSLLTRPYFAAIAGQGFDFYSSTARTWQLFAGVLAGRLLALPGHPLAAIRGKARNLLALASLALLLAGFATEFSFLPVGKGLALTGAATLLILLCTAETLPGRLLASRPFRFVGNISYSLYMWHWPIWCFSTLLCFKYGLDLDWRIKVAQLAATFLLSTASWKWIEEPLRRGNYGWKQLIPPAGAAFLLIGVLAAFMIGGAATETADPAAAQTFTPRTRFGVLGEWYTLGVRKDAPDFLAVGDSHLDALAPALDALGLEYGLAGRALNMAALPFPGLQQATDAGQFRDKVQTMEHVFAVAEEYKITDVLLVYRWNMYVFGSIPKLNTAYTQEESVPMSESGAPTQSYSPEVFERHLRLLADSAAKANLRLWIVEQAPALPADPALLFRLVGGSPNAQTAYHDDRMSRLRDMVASLARENLRYLPIDQFFRDQDSWTYVEGGRLLYRDDDHVNARGAMLAKNGLAPFFDAVRPVPAERAQ